jgi:hypothetical protein
MSSSYDTVGVCTRCGAAEFDLERVHVCPDCRKGWQLMPLKDAVHLLSDALRAKGGAAPGDQVVIDRGGAVVWLDAIARNGGTSVDGTPWTGSHCAEIARIGLKRISEGQVS